MSKILRVSWDDSGLFLSHDAGQQTATKVSTIVKFVAVHCSLLKYPSTMPTFGRLLWMSHYCTGLSGKYLTATVR